MFVKQCRRARPKRHRSWAKVVALLWLRSRRTTRRSDGNFRAARYRAVTPFAVIIKSSMISLALFLFSTAKSLISSPSNTGRASIVSRSSAPCSCRMNFSFCAGKLFEKPLYIVEHYFDIFEFCARRQAFKSACEALNNRINQR